MVFHTIHSAPLSLSHWSSVPASSRPSLTALSVKLITSQTMVTPSTVADICEEPHILCSSLALPVHHAVFVLRNEFSSSAISPSLWNRTVRQNKIELAVSLQSSYCVRRRSINPVQPGLPLEPRQCNPSMERKYCMTNYYRPNGRLGIDLWSSARCIKS